MSLTHKQKQRRDDKDKALAKAWFAAGRTVDYVCPTCGGGALDQDKCKAPLDVRCGGFEAVEKAYAEFEGHWQNRFTEADL